MPISLDELQKLESSSVTEAALQQYSEDDTLTAIVKVNKPNYVPSDVKLRARVDEQMFTGEFAAKYLEKINSDPYVQSVALRKKLRQIG